jgi:hypothetical protein
MIIPSSLHGIGFAVLAVTLLIGSALQVGTLLGRAPATPILHYATIALLLVGTVILVVAESNMPTP